MLGRAAAAAVAAAVFAGRGFFPLLCRRLLSFFLLLVPLHALAGVVRNEAVPHVKVQVAAQADAGPPGEVPPVLWVKCVFFKGEKKIK